MPSKLPYDYRIKTGDTVGASRITMHCALLLTPLVPTFIAFLPGSLNSSEFMSMLSLVIMYSNVFFNPGIIYYIWFCFVSSLRFCSFLQFASFCFAWFCGCKCKQPGRNMCCKTRINKDRWKIVTIYVTIYYTLLYRHYFTLLFAYIYTVYTYIFYKNHKILKFFVCFWGGSSSRTPAVLLSEVLQEGGNWGLGIGLGWWRLVLRTWRVWLGGLGFG